MALSKPVMIVGGGVAVVALALGIGLTRADFGSRTNAEAEPVSQAACPEPSVTVAAPSTVPVNSSALVSASANISECAYPDGAIISVVINDATPPQNIPQWIDTSAGLGSATSENTLNGSDYQVGDTVKVAAVLTDNNGSPAPVVETTTVTVVAAQTDNPQVTIEVPSTTVLAGQEFALSGTATAIDPALYPNGVNLQLLLDGAVVGQTSIIGQSSGSVTATVPGAAAGSHIATTQLTTGTGAPAATAQQTFTIEAAPAG